MSDQFVSALVAVFDQLGVVNASQTVQRNTDFQIVFVADLEKAFSTLLATYAQLLAEGSLATAA